MSVCVHVQCVCVVFEKLAIVIQEHIHVLFYLSLFADGTCNFSKAGGSKQDGCHGHTTEEFQTATIKNS